MGKRVMVMEAPGKRGRGRICGQESDGDGGAGEKRERKTESKVVG